MDPQPSKPTPKRGYLSLDAVNPADGSHFEVWISRERAEAVAKRGRHAVCEMGYVVSEVLRKPRRVYEGVRWEGDQDRHRATDEWLCYIGLPTADFRTPDSDRPSQPGKGKLFLVFVNRDRIAYNWRWEPAAEGTVDVPCGQGDSESRFGKQVL